MVKLVGGGSDINVATPSSIGEYAFYPDFPKANCYAGTKMQSDKLCANNCENTFEEGRIFDN